MFVVNLNITLEGRNAIDADMLEPLHKTLSIQNAHKMLYRDADQQQHII